jgi:hypothetical protein
MAKTEKRQPWLKFYGSDWRGDAALRSCSYGARGLWIDMLTLMHEAEPYGHLTINGRALEAKQLAGLFGGSPVEVGKLLAELDEAGVFSRSEDRTIYSRRMVADNLKLERDRDNGKGGGNPRLRQRDNVGVNPPGNPPVEDGDKAHIPDTRKKDTSSLRSLGDELPAAPEPIDPTKALWAAAKPALSRLLAKPEAAIGSVIGKLRAAYGNDDDRLLEQIRAAEAERPADPVSWLMARRTGLRTAAAAPKNPCPDDPPEAWSALAEGWEVDRSGVRRPLAGGYFLDLTAAAVADAALIRTDWRGDWSTLAGWLRDLKNDAPILTAIRKVASRNGYEPPGTLRYFDQAVRGAA